jgi:putative pyruvate formate lyase activating enzyme
MFSENHNHVKFAGRKIGILNILDKIDYEAILEPLIELENCRFCPRNCNVNRFSAKNGYCKSDAGFNIASICIHKGEEPVISGDKGICNVFFSRCNMRCIFCQNHQISRTDDGVVSYKMHLRDILEEILKILDTGVESVGFVSPSHFIPQVKVIVAALNQIGRKPVIVYNTNGYDTVSSIKELQGIVDVYLPDFKYMYEKLSVMYSDAPRYSHYASNAILEMYRQKGSTVITSANNYAESGLIIRHLVLPGCVENSLAVLRYIADEISTNVHISLMSQYYPNEFVKNHPVVGRVLTAEEYLQVTREMEKLGFTKGWIQELQSADFYQPDFLNSHPFISNM